MKIPVDYLGEFVMVQLARPVYMAAYAGHTKDDDGQDLYMAQPILKEGKDGAPVASMTDVLMAAMVKEVRADSVTLELYDPDPGNPSTGNLTEITLDNNMVIACSSVVGFEVPLPVVTVHERAKKSGLIL